MTVKPCAERKSLRTLEYVLHDFLEVKASLDPEKAKPLKKFLFSQSLDGETLSTLEGFSLAKQLVLFEQSDPESFQNLIFLNPEDGAIQIKRLSD